MALAFTMRGLAPVAKVRTDHNWVDVEQTKKLPRTRLHWWLNWGATEIANWGKQEAPGSSGAGRSWINSYLDEDAHAAYAGVISGPGTIGGVPKYMGMIQRGIKKHFVPFKHRGLRVWYLRTLGLTAAYLKKKGLDPTKGGMVVWGSLHPPFYTGPRREMIGGKVAIPWLSRAVKKSLPAIRSKLRELARTS